MIPMKASRRILALARRGYPPRTIERMLERQGIEGVERRDIYATLRQARMRGAKGLPKFERFGATVSLPAPLAARLAKQAALRSVPLPVYARNLLAAVANDNLASAILD